MEFSGEVIDKKKIFNSFVWKVLERLFTQGINLIVQIVLARILLPDDFGSLAIIVAITNYAAIFVQSGISTVIIQKKDIDNLDISTLLSSSLLIALIVYLLIFIFAPLVSAFYSMPSLTWPLRILGLILFFNAINSIQTAILIRNLKFKSLFFRSVIAIPISGTIGIGMALSGYGIWALIFQILSNILIVDIIMSFGLNCKFSLSFSLKRARKLFPFCVGLLMTSLLAGFSDILRTLTIGKKYTTESLAYYDKANTYSAYATQIATQSTASVLLPTFSRSQENYVRLKGMVRKSVRLTCFIMMPLLAFVAINSHQIISILLTEKWLGCVKYLQIFCLLRIAICISTIDKQVYFAMGNSLIGVYYEIGLLIFNTILLVFALPFGIMYLAIGITLVELVGMLILFLVSNKLFNYSFKERLKDLVKPIVSTSTLIVWLIIVNSIILNSFLQLILGFIFGVIIYLFTSYFLKDECMDSIRLRK